jgi:hypothetical protein
VLRQRQSHTLWWGSVPEHQHLQFIADGDLPLCPRLERFLDDPDGVLYVQCDDRAGLALLSSCNQRKRLRTLRQTRSSRRNVFTFPVLPSQRLSPRHLSKSGCMTACRGSVKDV